MKTLLLAALMAASMQSFAGQEGGGGDPIVIMAQDFNNVSKLYQVRDILEEKFKNVGSLNGLDEKVIQELNSLIENRKIKTLPAILILGNQGNVGNYQIPHDANKFVALGGMTYLEAGAPVYLAERVSSYSPKKLSALILHEIFHHVVRDELKFDEEFIERLSSEVMSEKISPKVRTAINEGYYFTQDKVYAAQLWNALKMDEIAALCQSSDRPNFTANFKKWFAKKGNLAEMEIYGTSQEFVVPVNGPGGCRGNAFNPEVSKRILRFVREVNPNSKLLQNSPFGCRVNMKGWNPSDACDESLRFGEVFSGKE